MKEINEYEKQANDFLIKTGATMTIEFFAHMPHFDGDKEKRDVYNVTIRRGNNDYTFKFGQSIFNSGSVADIAAHTDSKQYRQLLSEGYKPKYGKAIPNDRTILHKKRIVPSAYDILSCLTKNGPGTFEDFCSEFGYDTDSKKAEKIYFAVQKEFAGIKKLFGDVMDDLQEIN